MRAIKFVKDFVIGSATSAVGAYQYTPFKLASMSRKRASEFQIAFVQNGVRYEYNFSMGPTQIEREWLIEYVHAGARARGRTMFERTWDSRKKQYIWTFSSFLKGQRSVWSESTRPDALFLSTAIQLNSIQLRPVFEWFQKRLVVIAGEIRLNKSMTIKLLEESNGKDRLLPFLQEADLGIADLKVKQEPLPSGGRVIVGKPGVMLHQKTPDSTLSVVTVTLSHSSDDPKSLVGLDFDEKSSGNSNFIQDCGRVAKRIC